MNLSYREAQAPRKKKTPTPTVPIQPQQPVQSEEDALLQKLIVFDAGIVGSSEKLEILKTLPKDKVSSFLQENIGVAHRILASIFFSGEGLDNNLLGLKDKSTGSLSFFFLEDYGINYDLVIPNFVGYKDYTPLVPVLLGYVVRLHVVDTAHDRFIFSILNSMTPEMFGGYVQSYYRGNTAKVVSEFLRISFELGNALSLLPRLVELSGISVFDIYTSSVTAEDVDMVLPLSLLKQLLQKEIRSMTIGELVTAMLVAISNGDTVFAKQLLAIAGQDVGAIYKEAKENNVVAVAEFLRQEYSEEYLREPFEPNIEYKVAAFVSKKQETKWSSMVDALPGGEIPQIKAAFEILQDGFKRDPVTPEGQMLQKLLKVQPEAEAFVDLLDQILFKRTAVLRLSKRQIFGQDELSNPNPEELVTEYSPALEDIKEDLDVDIFDPNLPKRPVIPKPDKPKRVYYPQEDIQLLQTSLYRDGYLTKEDLTSLVVQNQAMFGALIPKINIRARWTIEMLQELYSWARSQTIESSISSDKLLQIVLGRVASPYIRTKISSQPLWSKEEIKLLVESMGLSVPVHTLRGNEYRDFIHDVHILPGEPFTKPGYGSYVGKGYANKEQADAHEFSVMLPFKKGWVYPKELDGVNWSTPHVNRDMISWLRIEPFRIKQTEQGKPVLKDIWLVQEHQSDFLRDLSDNNYTGKVDDVTNILNYIQGTSNKLKPISGLSTIPDQKNREQQQAILASGVEELRVEYATTKRVDKDKLKNILTQTYAGLTLDFSELSDTITGMGKRLKEQDFKSLMDFSAKKRIESEKYGRLDRYFKDAPVVMYKHILNLAKAMNVSEVWLPTGEYAAYNWHDAKSAKATIPGYKKYYDTPAKVFGGMVVPIPKEQEGMVGDTVGSGVHGNKLTHIIRLKVSEIPTRLLAKRE